MRCRQCALTLVILLLLATSVMAHNGLPEKSSEWTLEQVNQNAAEAFKNDPDRAWEVLGTASHMWSAEARIAAKEDFKTRLSSEIVLRNDVSKTVKSWLSQLSAEDLGDLRDKVQWFLGNNRDIFRSGAGENYLNKVYGLDVHLEGNEHASDVTLERAMLVKGTIRVKLEGHKPGTAIIPIKDSILIITPGAEDAPLTIPSDLPGGIEVDPIKKTPNAFEVRMPGRDELLVIDSRTVKEISYDETNIHFTTHTGQEYLMPLVEGTLEARDGLVTFGAERNKPLPVEVKHNDLWQKITINKGKTARVFGTNEGIQIDGVFDVLAYSPIIGPVKASLPKGEKMGLSVYIGSGEPPLPANPNLVVIRTRMPGPNKMPLELTGRASMSYTRKDGKAVSVTGMIYTSTNGFDAAGKHRMLKSPSIQAIQEAAAEKAPLEIMRYNKDKQKLDEDMQQIMSKEDKIEQEIKNREAKRDARIKEIEEKRKAVKDSAERKELEKQKDAVKQEFKEFEKRKKQEIDQYKKSDERRKWEKYKKNTEYKALKNALKKREEMLKKWKENLPRPIASGPDKGKFRAEDIIKSGITVPILETTIVSKNAVAWITLEGPAGMRHYEDIRPAIKLISLKGTEQIPFSSEWGLKSIEQKVDPKDQTRATVIDERGRIVHVLRGALRVETQLLGKDHATEIPLQDSKGNSVHSRVLLEVDPAGLLAGAGKWGPWLAGKITKKGNADIMEITQGLDGTIRVRGNFKAVDEFLPHLIFADVGAKFRQGAARDLPIARTGLVGTLFGGIAESGFGEQNPFMQLLPEALTPMIERISASPGAWRISKRGMLNEMTLTLHPGKSTFKTPMEALQNTNDQINKGKDAIVGYATKLAKSLQERLNIHPGDPQARNMIQAFAKEAAKKDPRARNIVPEVVLMKDVKTELPGYLKSLERTEAVEIMKRLIATTNVDIPLGGSFPLDLALIGGIQNSMPVVEGMVEGQDRKGNSITVASGPMHFQISEETARSIYESLFVPAILDSITGERKPTALFWAVTQHPELFPKGRNDPVNMQFAAALYLLKYGLKQDTLEDRFREAHGLPGIYGHENVPTPPSP